MSIFSQAFSFKIIDDSFSKASYSIQHPILISYDDDRVSYFGMNRVPRLLLDRVGRRLEWQWHVRES